MAHITCLVSLVRIVSGHYKNALGKGRASSTRHITNLGNLLFFGYLWWPLTSLTRKHKTRAPKQCSNTFLKDKQTKWFKIGNFVKYFLLLLWQSQTWHEFVVVGDADVLALLHCLDVVGVSGVGTDAVFVHLIFLGEKTYFWKTSIF